MTAYQILAIEENASTATTVLRASVMRGTQEICAKRKSTNANRIPVNMEDTVKI